EVRCRLAGRDEVPCGVGDELAVAADQLVQLTQPGAILLDGEARDPPDDLAQQVDDGSDVANLDPGARGAQLDDLQACGAGGGDLVVVVPIAAGLRLRPGEELDELERAGRPDVL